MKDKTELLKILEEMPTGTSRKLKIGENDYALEAIKKSQPEITMQDIRDHNHEARGYDEGFKDAVEKYKEWRNEQYLILKDFK